MAMLALHALTSIAVSEGREQRFALCIMEALTQDGYCGPAVAFIQFGSYINLCGDFFHLSFVSVYLFRHPVIHFSLFVFRFLLSNGFNDLQ